MIKISRTLILSIVLAFGIAVISTLIVLFWFYRILIGGGISVKDIEDVSVGLGQAYIHKAVLETELGQVEIESAQIDYSLAQILRGHLRKVSLERLKLSLSSKSHNIEQRPRESIHPILQKATNTAFEVHSFLEGLSIPVAQIEINSAQIAIEGYQEIALSLSFEQPLSLSAQMQLKDETLKLNAKRTETNNLVLEVVSLETGAKFISTLYREVANENLKLEASLVNGRDFRIIDLPFGNLSTRITLHPTGEIFVDQLAGDFEPIQDYYLQISASGKVNFGGGSLELLIQDGASFLLKADEFGEANMSVKSPLHFRFDDKENFFDDLYFIAPLHISIQNLNLPVLNSLVDLQNVSINSNKGAFFDQVFIFDSKAVVKKNLYQKFPNKDLVTLLTLKFMPAQSRLELDLTNRDTDLSLRADCNLRNLLLVDEASCQNILLMFNHELIKDLLPSSLRLGSGKFSLSGSIEWVKSRISSSLRASASSLNAAIGDVLLSNAKLENAKVEINPLNPLKLALITEKPVEVSSIDAGVALKDIKFHVVAKMDGATYSVALQDLTGKALGGVFASSKLQVPSAEGQCQRTTLELTGLKLTELTNLYGSDDFYAEGEIFGKLPLDICTDGVSIENGKANASEQGGAIRYRPASGKGATKELDLLLKILDDYRFKSLIAELNLSKSGDLKTQIAISGVSFGLGKGTDMNKGQEVNVNLGLEENIPALLKSLRVGGQVTEEIRRKVQQPASK